MSHFAQIVGHLVWLNGRGISEAMKFQLARAGHFGAVQDCYEWKKLSSRTDRPADQLRGKTSKQQGIAGDAGQ